MSPPSRKIAIQLKLMLDKYKKKDVFNLNDKIIQRSKIKQ